MRQNVLTFVILARRYLLFTAASRSPISSEQAQQQLPNLGHSAAVGRNESSVTRVGG
jgi:hypothetical protein